MTVKVRIPWNECEILYLENDIDQLNTFKMFKDKVICIIHLDLDILSLFFNMLKKIPFPLTTPPLNDVSLTQLQLEIKHVQRKPTPSYQKANDYEKKL